MRLSRISAFLAILTPVLLSYWYALGGEMFGDDLYRIQFSPELSSLKSALTSGLMDRPLLMLSIWIDSSLFGINAFYMRLVNVLIHALVAQQLYETIKVALRHFGRRVDDLLVLALVILFALHPLHNQAINLIVQRGILLSSLFGIISMRYFFLYLPEGKLRFLLCSTLALLLGVLSKPNVIFLPFLFTFLCVLSPHSSLRSRKLMVLVFAPLLYPVVMYTMAKVNVQASSVTVSPLEYFLLQSKALLVYLRLMVFPYGLKYLHDLKPPSSLIYNYYWILVGMHALFLLLMGRVLRDKTSYLWLLSIYLAFAPESSFFPIIHPIFEHRTYLPMVFVCIFLVFLLSKLELKVSRSSLMAFLIIGAIYIGMNQIRNHQIHTLVDWQLHTLRNSHSRHMYNFMYSVDLMSKGYAKELTSVIGKYSKLYPRGMQYTILAEIHEFYLSDKISRQKTLASLSELLANNEMIVPLRRGVNLFIIYELLGQSMAVDDLKATEQILSRQLQAFFAEQKEFSILIDKYEDVAERMKTYYYGNQTEKDRNYLQYLRIRAFLAHYYSHPDPSIVEDIESALRNNPNSGALRRLREMLTR